MCRVVGDQTSLAGGCAVLPVAAAFRAAHPGIVLRYLTGEASVPLEYGEAQCRHPCGPRSAEIKPEMWVTALHHNGPRILCGKNIADQARARQPCGIPKHYFVAMTTKPTAPRSTQWPLGKPFRSENVNFPQYRYEHALEMAHRARAWGSAFSASGEARTHPGCFRDRSTARASRMGRRCHCLAGEHVDLLHTHDQEWQ